MPPDSTAFDDHLTVGESPVTVGAGALFQEVRWTPAEICVTDRRVLFVPAEGGFVDVPRHQVQSIRSRPTTRRANREIAALVLLVGGLAATALAAGSLLSGGGPLVPLFALVGALGALATAAIVGRDLALDGDDVAAGVERIDGALATVDDWIAAADERVDADLDVDVQETVDVHREAEPRVAEFAEAYPVARWAAAGVGVVGAAGLLLVGSWAALGLAAVAAVGVGAAAYGIERLRALEDAGQRIRRQRSVCLYLVDGRTVRFRIDDDADIDRELSRLTAQTPDGALPPARSADRAGGNGTGDHTAGESGSGKRGPGRSGV